MIKKVGKESIKAKDQKPPKSESVEKFEEDDENNEDMSSESEGCDGPMLDEELAEATSSGGLSVSRVDHNSFIPASLDDEIYLPDTFFSGKKRHHKRNLIIEGSCNYFFWMEKIAMVSSSDNVTCPIFLYLCCVVYFK